ncbi:ABC transporter permease [Okibacterium endophyticum]
MMATAVGSAPVDAREKVTMPWSVRLTQWHYLLAYATMAIAAIAAVLTPPFVSPNNLTQLVAGVSDRALIILPLALIIIIREIDLSVASIMGLCSVTLGVTLQAGVPLPVALVVTMAVGAAAGAFNGFFVSFLRLPAIIVTLGSLALFRGLCYIILGSQSINTFPEALTNFGFLNIPGTRIPYVILPFIVLAIVYAIVLHKSGTGRRILALGGNPDAAKYSGVRTRRLTMWLFITTGLVCSIGGIVYTARLASSRADNAFGLELDVITIVFLGGVSMLGGKGNVAGIIWALALVSIVRNVLGLNQVGGDVQGTVVGLILIGSLLLTNTVGATFSRRRRSRLQSLFVAEPVTAEPGKETAVTTR